MILNLIFIFLLIFSLFFFFTFSLKNFGTKHSPKEKYVTKSKFNWFGEWDTIFIWSFYSSRVEFVIDLGLDWTLTILGLGLSFRLELWLVLGLGLGLGLNFGLFWAWAWGLNLAWLMFIEDINMWFWKLRRPLFHEGYWSFPYFL